MDSIKYRAGYKYQLHEDFEIQVSIKPEKEEKDDYIILDTDGKLTIKKGYAWDGPIGPTIDTATFMRGALVHDALYQLMREERIDRSHREAADDELRKIILKDGMSRLRAWWVHRAVRLAAAIQLSYSGHIDSARSLLDHLQAESDTEVKTEIFVALGAACKSALSTWSRPREWGRWRPGAKAKARSTPKISWSSGRSLRTK